MPRRKRVYDIPLGQRLLTIQEVEQRLEVSPDTVYRRIYDGLLERVYIGEKSPRITGSSLDAYVQAKREGREPPRYQVQKDKPNSTTAPEKPPERGGVVSKLKGWLGV
jgi:excisionase family DNA binding protein